MITLTRVCLGLLIIHSVNPKVAKSVDDISKGSISLKNPSKIDIVVTVKSGADELNRSENCQTSVSDDIDLKSLGDTKPADDIKPSNDVKPASDPKSVVPSLESLSSDNNEACDDSGSETETTTTELFVCSKPGSYPSPDKCSDFYICHKKDQDSNGMERIKLSCPKGMIFDKNIKKCTSRSDASCLKSKKSYNHQ